MEPVYYQGSNAYTYLQEVNMLGQQDSIQAPTNLLSQLQQLKQYDDNNEHQQGDSTFESQQYNSSSKNNKKYLYNIRLPVVQNIMDNIELCVIIFAFYVQFLWLFPVSYSISHLLTYLVICFSIFVSYSVIYVQCKLNHKITNNWQYQQQQQQQLTDQKTKWRQRNNPNPSQTIPTHYHPQPLTPTPTPTPTPSLTHQLHLLRKLICQHSAPINQRQYYHNYMREIKRNVYAICLPLFAADRRCYDGMLGQLCGHVDQQLESNVGLYRKIGRLSSGVVRRYGQLCFGDQNQASFKLQHIPSTIIKVYKFNKYQVQLQRAYHRLLNYYNICSNQYSSENGQHDEYPSYNHEKHQDLNYNKILLQVLISQFKKYGKLDKNNLDGQHKYVTSHKIETILNIIKLQLIHQITSIRNKKLYQNRNIVEGDVQNVGENDQNSNNQHSLSNKDRNRQRQYLQISTDGNLRQLEEQYIGTKIDELKGRLDFIFNAKVQGQNRKDQSKGKEKTKEQKQEQEGLGKLQRRVQGFGSIFSAALNHSNRSKIHQYYIQ